MAAWLTCLKDNNMKPRLVIIGAGLAGVSLALRCRDAMQVTLIEKSRGVAGRMSTRRLDDQVFDHGAQYFTIRDDRFAAMLAPYMKAGVVAPWQARIVTVGADRKPQKRDMPTPPMIALPGMTGLVKAMAEGLEIMTVTEAAAITRHGTGWQISDRDNQPIIDADMVVTAIPAPQARRMLPPNCDFLSRLDDVRMQGCFTFMLGYDEDLGLAWDATFVEDSPLGFVANNTARPEHGGGTALTVQTTNLWAEDRLDLATEDIEAALTKALADHLGIDAGAAMRRRLHRWRYASVSQPLGAAFALDEEKGLAAIGDWCLRGRVEAAFESATALADHLGMDG